MEMYPDEEMSVTITGHSLGGALAIVGNVRFKERAETVGSVGLKVLRVVNARDGVPKSPGLFPNEGLPQAALKAVEWLLWCFSHVDQS
ncbi:hypothetical protein RHGRI_002895 [Rhododendron griersonianum]|uniref:Fungal lipase-type domain-containing protein n=1 Tax=Rhododendron griersonianum TaxID=479676 RepID=A0AAV6LT28_9ERIC|nr:hypothetical protein RHGRI_002895 [Rhododendron griersonianum]